MRMPERACLRRAVSRRARAWAQPVAALLLVAIMSSAARAQTIDTRTGAVLSGVVTTPLFGQTVTAPGGASHLTGFSFFLRSNVSSTDPAAVPSTFRAYLFAWEAAGIAGAALYESALRPASVTSGLSEESFTLDAPLPVSAGDLLAVIIVPEDGTLVHGMTRDAGGAVFDSYAGGTAVSAVCGAALSLLDCTWFTLPTYDRAATATFVQVPEPSAGVLLLTAAVGLLLVQRGRTRRRT